MELRRLLRIYAGKEAGTLGAADLSSCAPSASTDLPASIRAWPDAPKTAYEERLETLIRVATMDEKEAAEQAEYWTRFAYERERNKDGGTRKP